MKYIYYKLQYIIYIKTYIIYNNDKCCYNSFLKAFLKRDGVIENEEYKIEVSKS